MIELSKQYHAYEEGYIYAREVCMMKAVVYDGVGSANLNGAVMYSVVSLSSPKGKARFMG